MIPRRSGTRAAVLATPLLLMAAAPATAADGRGVKSRPAPAARGTELLGPDSAGAARDTEALGPGGVYANIPPRDEHGRDQLAMFRAWNPDPVGHHQANLRAISPALARVIRKVQADAPDLRFVIGSGLRSDALQRKALAWGWSATPVSAHQSGLAVDLWPLDPDGRVLFDPALQNRIAAAMRTAAAALGVRIRWGGAFRGYKHGDRSHFELMPAEALNPSRGR